MQHLLRQPMRILTASALALACAALPLAAQDDDLDDAKWEVLYLDAEGAEVRRQQGVETVARVMGPRDTYMQIGCNENSGDRYLRIARASEDRNAQFAGEEFTALAEVHSGGGVLHSEDLTLRWREADGDAETEGEEGYYQTRARARLGNALREGFRVVLTEETRDIRIPFTLRGSYVAIDAVPCD